MKLSSAGSKVYGSAVRRLRAVTEKTLDEEPKWRTKGRELQTGFQKTW